MTAKFAADDADISGSILQPLDRPSNIANPNYIATLDGWRAIAVSLVIGSHSVTMLQNGGTRIGAALSSILSHAGYGVDLFFALSGFLISTLLLREKSRKGSIDLGRFYVRRAFRILPPIVIYIATVTSISTIVTLPAFGLSEVASSLLFARNYTDGSWYTGHFWSLSIEEHFYLFSPLLILLLKRRTLLKCFLLLIGMCILVRAYELSHADMFQPMTQFRTENRIDALMWGSILALLYSNEEWREKLRRLLPLPTIILLIATVFALVTIVEAQAFRRTIMAIALPLVIVHSILRPEGLVGRFLELSPIRLIGRMSYSLYIWQMLFLVPFHRPLGLLQSFPLNFVMTLGCASISYWLVEKPMIRLGHKLSMRHGGTTNAKGSPILVEN